MSDHRGQSPLSPIHRKRDDLRPLRGESGHSTGYSSGRERIKRDSRRSQSERRAYRPTHPLMSEMERLLQACEAHEREIRQSQNTINHQLAEWSGKFDTLHDIDTQAEKMAFDVKQMLDDTKTEHTELVDKCVQDGERWVDETRSKMEAWNEEWPDQKEKGDKWELWKGKIQLAHGYYEGEQERLDALLAEKLRTRRRVSRVVRYTCGSIMLFVLVILILLWTFEWRKSQDIYDRITSCFLYRLPRWIFVQTWSLGHLAGWLLVGSAVGFWEGERTTVAFWKEQRKRARGWRGSLRIIPNSRDDQLRSITGLRLYAWTVVGYHNGLFGGLMEVYNITGCWLKRLKMPACGHLVYVAVWVILSTSSGLAELRREVVEVMRWLSRIVISAPPRLYVIPPDSHDKPPRPKRRRKVSAGRVETTSSE